MQCVYIKAASLCEYISLLGCYLKRTRNQVRPSYLSTLSVTSSSPQLFLAPTNRFHTRGSTRHGIEPALAPHRDFQWSHFYAVAGLAGLFLALKSDQRPEALLAQSKPSSERIISREEVENHDREETGTKRRCIHKDGRECDEASVVHLLLYLLPADGL